jgi:hypothetical protein
MVLSYAQKLTCVQPWCDATCDHCLQVIRPGELLAANITLVLPLNQSQPIAREVVKAILATTVGPYELISACGLASVRAGKPSLAVVHIPGPDTEAVADFLDDLFGRRQDARASPLFAHYPTEQLRGLHSVTRLTAKRGSDMTAATQTGLNAARNPLVVLLDDETEQLDYGWDRQLLRPMAQSADLIAISGVCAYDLTPPTAPDGRTAWVPSSLAGHCARTPKDVVQLPVSYDVRDVAVQSPLLVDRTKLRRLGTLRGDLSSLGHQPFAAEVRDRAVRWPMLTRSADVFEGETEAQLAMRPCPCLPSRSASLATGVPSTGGRADLPQHPSYRCPGDRGSRSPSYRLWRSRLSPARDHGSQVCTPSDRHRRESEPFYDDAHLLLLPAALRVGSSRRL